jgi:replicative DNA helicase
MACAGAKVNLWELRTGKSEEDKKEKLWAEARNIALPNLIIEDSPNLRAGDICSKSRTFASERKLIKEGLDLVIIDSPPDIGTESILRFKELARSLDTAVILTMSLPRAYSKTTDLRPRLCELANTSAAEYADVICFIHREWYYKRDDETLKDRATLIIAKNREGYSGEIDLKFEAEYSLFSEREPEDMP